MRAFACPHCAALIYFESSRCVTCDSALGYLRSTQNMVWLTPPADLGSGDGLGYTDADGVRWVRCANAVIAACNWLAGPVSAGQDGQLCPSCALTRTRPADTDAAALVPFARTETAKRRLLFQLDILGLPTTSRREDPTGGLAFDLLSSAGGPVITGHADGVITINLAEGDDPHREAVRASLGEPYRTLLGHLRHEIGHWYWDILIAPVPTQLAHFRVRFGDDRTGYAAALAAHYSRTKVSDWRESYVSDYAAVHPWEDWAETFAHYLHLADTLQTANAYGMLVAGPDLKLAAEPAFISTAPRERYVNFDEMLASWLALTYALNAVNRSMGKDDLYPFVLVPEVIDKLRFVHRLLQAFTPQ